MTNWYIFILKNSSGNTQPKKLSRHTGERQVFQKVTHHSSTHI